MTYVVRPISDRTPFTGRSRQSPFDSLWSSTEELLLREVRALKGRDPVIEVDVGESQIRNDGRLYARATAASPAVRVAFESEHGPLTYATDRFSTWQDNVRAIALSLEALRKVDRYGVTKRGEQYTGFKALGAGTAMPASHMTTDEAWSIIGSYQERPVAVFRENATAADLKAAHRRARAACHPDRHGGETRLWDRVEEAARLIGATA